MPGGWFCTVTSTPHHPQKAEQQELRGTIETSKKTPVDSRRAVQEDIAQGQRATMFHRSVQEGPRNCSIALGSQGNASKGANAQTWNLQRRRTDDITWPPNHFAAETEVYKCIPTPTSSLISIFLLQNGLEAQRFKNWILKFNDF